jgi:hypothetical protein
MVLRQLHRALKCSTWIYGAAAFGAARDELCHHSPSYAEWVWGDFVKNDVALKVKLGFWGTQYQ